MRCIEASDFELPEFVKVEHFSCDLQLGSMREFVSPDQRGCVFGLEIINCCKVSLMVLEYAPHLNRRCREELQASLEDVSDGYSIQYFVLLSISEA